MCFDICAINIRVSIRVRGLHLVLFAVRVGCRYWIKDYCEDNHQFAIVVCCHQFVCRWNDFQRKGAFYRWFGTPTFWKLDIWHTLPWPSNSSSCYDHKQISDVNLQDIPPKLIRSWNKGQIHPHRKNFERGSAKGHFRYLKRRYCTTTLKWKICYSGFGGLPPITISHENLWTMNRQVQGILQELGHCTCLCKSLQYHVPQFLTCQMREKIRSLVARKGMTETSLAVLECPRNTCL